MDILDLSWLKLEEEIEGLELSAAERESYYLLVVSTKGRVRGWITSVTLRTQCGTRMEETMRLLQTWVWYADGLLL